MFSKNMSFRDLLQVLVWILDAVFMYFLSTLFLFIELLLGSLQELNLRTWFCKTCFFESESSVFSEFPF